MTLLYRTKRGVTVFTAIILISLLSGGCKKLITIDAPVSSISQQNVYASEPTAISVMNGVYSLVSFNGFSGLYGLSLCAGLSADELTLWNGQSDATLRAFYRNALAQTASQQYGGGLWTLLYPYVYTCNAVIEGVSATEALRPAVKQQLLGEAFFTRAYVYFILVNLYGQLPLVVSTDYQKNVQLSRSPVDSIYAQILRDLQTAEPMLSDNFPGATLLTATDQRVRPTRWAANALLAKVYLAEDKWAEAEAAASTVIDQHGLFGLMHNPDSVFLANNNEAIWQIQPTLLGHNTEEAITFVLPGSGPTDYNAGGGQAVYLSDRLLQAFEAGDQRRTHWVDSVVVGGVNYRYAYKYKVNLLNQPVTEYLTLLRLGEIYLVRAEARARLGRIADAQDDLNIVRHRAGLGDTPAATDEELVDAVMRERRVELFTEQGARWMDLKRSGSVDAVMTVETPLKGGSWKSFQQWYPVPFDDVNRAPNLEQTTGY